MNEGNFARKRTARIVEDMNRPSCGIAKMTAKGTPAVYEKEQPARYLRQARIG